MFRTNNPARAAQCLGSGRVTLGDRLACGLGLMPQLSDIARLPPRRIVGAGGGAPPAQRRAQ